MEITKEQVLLAFENKEYDIAEKLAREYLQFDSMGLEIKIILGRSLGNQGNFDDALVVFQEAQQSNPLDAETTYYLARTYELLKDFDKSLVQYKKLEWDKSYGTLANYRMGLIHSDYSKNNHNTKLAVHHFLVVTKSEHPVEDSFLRLANLENGMRSIYVLQNGIKIFPKSKELHTKLARHYLNSVGDFAGCIESVKKAQNEGVDSPSLRFICSLANYQLGNYSDALNLLSVNAETDGEKIEILLLKSMIHIEQKEFDISLGFLDEIIRMDISNVLNYVAHLIALCCCIRDANSKEIYRFADEIPLDAFTFRFYDMNLPLVNFGAILDIEKYILVALDNTNYLNMDEKLIAKIDGLNALYLATKESKEKKDWKLIEKLVISALKTYPENSSLLKLKGECYSAFNKHRNAIGHYIRAQLISSENIYADVETEIKKIIENDNEMALVFNDIVSLFESYRWGVNNFSSYLLDDVVEVFFESKKYSYVIKICDLFQYSQLVRANVIFEVAYSYGELNNKAKSKQYYEAYLRDAGENSAVYNNLAMIYEKDGLTDKAKELVLQALKLEPEKEIYSNNLNRIHEKISAHVEQKKSYERAKNIFEQESLQTKRAIALIYSKRDDENLIFLTYEQLAKILNTDPYVVSDEVELLIGKKYFDRVTGKFPEDGFVLKLNSELTLQVEQQLEKYYKDAQIEKLVADLSYETLENKYEYSDELLKALTKIGSADFSAMLQRDLKEAVVSLATQSYKSALILCGSIVETILMDKLLADEKATVATFEKIQNRAGNSIKASDKKVENWNLNMLLDVAYELKIISTNLYHWGNGIRGFRNLVHPAVEKRQEMEVSKENAEIAWSVTRRLIKEISK